MKPMTVLKQIDGKSKVAALELIQGRAFRCLALYFWHVRSQSENQTLHAKEIRNACIQAVLITVRDLDDFFSLTEGRKTDLRANHFTGFQSKGNFLTENERFSINKYLAHITYVPIGSDVNPEWDTVDLAGKALRPAIEFMKFLGNELIGEFPEKTKLSEGARLVLEKTLKEMETVGESEKIHRNRVD